MRLRPIAATLVALTVLPGAAWAASAVPPAAHRALYDLTL